MRSKTKKSVLKMILCMAVLVMAVLVSAQSAKAQGTSKQKAAVTKDVKKMFQAAKKCDGNELDKYVKVWSKEQCSGTNPYDPAAQKLLPGYYNSFKKANKKLTYSIKSVSVKGKNATVKVKVNYADSKEYINKIVQIIYIDFVTGNVPPKVLAEIEAFNNISDAEIQKINALDANNPSDVLWAQNYLINNFSATKLYVDKACKKATAQTTFKATNHKTITLKMKKYNKTWKLSKANKGFENAITANLFANAKKAENDNPDLFKNLN